MRREISVAAVLAGFAAMAVAQQGGTQFSFDLSSELRASDNWTMTDPSLGDSFQFNNTAKFGISSSTRASKVSINLGARLHVTDIAGSSGEVSGVADPFANASFERNTADGGVSLSASISSQDRDIGTSTSMGTVINGDVSGGFTFGQNAPFGGSLNLHHSETDYTDGAPDSDERTTTASASLNLKPTSKLTLSPSASVVRNEVDAPSSDTETRTVALGATMDVSSAITVSLTASSIEIESEGSGNSSGVTYSASVEAKAQNGSHKVTGQTDISNSGQRTSLNYLRSLDWGGTQAQFGIGVAEGANGDQNMTANVSASRDLPRGALSASIERGYVTGADGAESLDTNIDLSYRQELTESSSLLFSAAFKETDPTIKFRESDTTVTASYSRQIASDWDLTAGVEHRISDDEIAPSAVSSNTVFIRFNRSWLAVR